jgi:hypothetical protein
MRHEPLETIKHGNYTIEIYPDEDSGFNPREADNLGIMVCFHKRYDLGDKHNYNYGDYRDWGKLERAIIKNEKPLVILPVYMYDHSGITIATHPFSCPWDSGQIGFIYTTKKQITLLGCDIINNKKEIIRQLEAEIKEYDAYLRGDIYGYVILDRAGETVESCAGYLDWDYCIQGAKSLVERMTQNEPQQIEMAIK